MGNIFKGKMMKSGEKHKKIVRIIYPVWLYVAITGVIIYFMISPYYK
jgi:putative membrane protein